MVRFTQEMRDIALEQSHAIDGSLRPTEPVLEPNEGRSGEIRGLLGDRCLSVTRDENGRGGVTYTVRFEANKDNFASLNTKIIGAGFARRSYSFISDNTVQVVYY